MQSEFLVSQRKILWEIFWVNRKVILENFTKRNVVLKLSFTENMF